MKSVFFLTLLLPAALQSASFDQVLERASRAAERQVAFLSSYACTEVALETKYNAKEKTESQQKQQFDYFVLVDIADGDLSVNESRIEQGKSKKENKQIAHSTGFALMMLVFHPFYATSFQFADAGPLIEGKEEFRKIAFHYVPGKRSPTLLKTGAREYPLSWDGEALVEARTGRIKHIQASLAAQLDDIGLKSLEVSVDYGVPPKVDETTDWAPLKAQVDLRTPKQHWHNSHTFQDFKKFEVSTSEKVGAKTQ